MGPSNVISGNGGNGVDIADVGGNLVAGNYIGTDVKGTKAVANGGDGILIYSNENTVGAVTLMGPSNVISGNGGYGVRISGGSNNLLINSYIGTDINGKNAIANAVGGVRIETGAADNTIGGTQSGLTNVISGNGTTGIANTGFGISLIGQATYRNVIQGNYIGVQADGMTPLGNQNSGIDTQGGADDTTIGGTVAGAGNVICANGNGSTGQQPGYGVDLRSSNNLVEDNNIGVLKNGAVLSNKNNWQNDTGLGNQWPNNIHD